ncbi:MAG: ribose 5-phosphate isomerase B [Bacteroidia bacterium]|nr:ribose 5-phosphate isomerase B [Bacteroidia bacterium]NNC86595.1 ribose 5-phosphate isomerase B [Bacteroidia bacterium]NNM15571.1 ribose 5-phosphate isomerase B [Bacteroidia bacterium]
MSKPNIVIGCDHAGYSLKEYLIKELSSNVDFTDKGTHNDESVDYPDYAHAVSNAIERGEYDFGILICGSANGVAIAANKHPNVRAAICWMDEISKLARAHNNANIICLPARYLSEEEALKSVNTFIETEFESGRHLRRVDKINL